MTSEIRTNTITSRAGLSTVTFTDSGPMFSGITTFVDNSGFNLGTGSSIFTPASNTLTFGTNSNERLRIDSSGNLVTGAQTSPTSSDNGNIYIKNGSAIGAVSHQLNYVTNAAFNSTWKYITSSVGATRIVVNQSGFQFDIAASGTAGNNITFSNRFNINNSGAIGVGGAYGSAGQVLTSAGSGSATTWSTITGTTINNNANNRLITGSGTANTLEGEANLQWDGETLYINRSSNSVEGLSISNSNNSQGSAAAQLNLSGGDNSYANVRLECNGTLHHIRQDGSGNLKFYNNTTERLRIKSDGIVQFNDNGGTYTNTVHSHSGEAGFITHYTARTTAGGDRYRRMLDIASGGANPHGSSIRLLTSPDDTNPATCVERVRITHEGRVGINKTQPQTMLSIKAERSATPRFGIDGHYSDSSYTQCTWDDSSGLYTLLGVNHKLDANGNDAGVVASLHSSSILLDGRSGNIRFNVKVNSGTSVTELMRIRDTGCVHIGNSLASAAAGRLQVVEERGGNQTNDCNAYFETNANDWNIKTYYNQSGTHYHIAFVEQGSFRGSVSGTDGSNVTFNSGSDYRWKENIVRMTGAEGIEICKKLQPSKYNWIENREETGQINTVDGFIAHEVVESGVLGAVTGEKDAVNEDGSIKGQMLDYGQMTPVLTAAIKGLIAKVETLEQDNIALRARVTNLEGN